MKRMSVLLVTAFAMSCVVRAQDDVYFIPSKEVRVVRSVDGTVVDNVAAVSSDASGYQEVRDVDEYNRRRTPADTSVSGTVKDVDASVGDYNDEVDYPCTKMVMRFYGPRPGIVVSSPYYWDICYGDVWGVYYDNWAWSTPAMRGGHTPTTHGITAVGIIAPAGIIRGVGMTRGGAVPIGDGTARSAGGVHVLH